MPVRTWVSPTGALHDVHDDHLYAFCKPRGLHDSNMRDHIANPKSKQKNDGWRLLERLSCISHVDRPNTIVPALGTLESFHEECMSATDGRSVLNDPVNLRKLLGGYYKGGGKPWNKWKLRDDLSVAEKRELLQQHQNGGAQPQSQPAVQPQPQLPNYAAIGVGSDVPFEMARSDPAGALNVTVHRTPLVPLEPCAHTCEAQLLFDLIPPPCARTRAICDRALSVHADAGATSAARGARSCSSASGSQEVSQGSNLAFARSCARCCAQISMVPTRSRAPVTRARRSILDLRRWSSMRCRAPPGSCSAAASSQEVS
jgi:hypothetical protein